VQEVEFYYGDGETVDPMTRERKHAAKRVTREAVQPAAPADGLDR
jgi:hypothetical protein